MPLPLGCPAGPALCRMQYGVQGLASSRALRDPFPAHGADPVGAGVDPCQGCLDLRQALPALVQQGGGLGQLEGDRCALGVVFVVDIGVLPGGIHRGDVPAQRGQECKFPAALLLKENPEPFDVDHRLQG